MTIKTVQTCNGCGKTQEIVALAVGGDGRWPQVGPDQHLCPDCVTKAIGASQ